MNWEWGGGHLPRPPFSGYQRVFFIQTIVGFFSIRSKISSSVRHLRFIRDHSQPVPLEETPDSFWKCFASQLWSPSLLQVFPHPAGTGTPRLPPGHLSTKVVPALQRQTFTILSGGGTPVQTSSGVILFAWRELTVHVLNWLHKEQQTRIHISLRIQKGQDTIKCQILHRSQRNSKSPNIQQIYANMSFPSA